MSKQITPLFLGPSDSPVFSFLKTEEQQVLQTEDSLTVESTFVQESSFLISYGYRHILTKEVLDHYAGNAINLHISYLPYNRGADPNLWSFLENSPKGVTIHVIDEGLDTGAILCQKSIAFNGQHTLASSYSLLKYEIEDLFIKNWGRLKSGEVKAIPQTGAGSYHSSRDKQKFSKHLTDGWDTPVDSLIGLALG